LLTAGAPGIHFYSLNQADAVLAIADNLDLTK
jgi:methylenetetrahydrofolate reductase (NADPH)